MLYFDCLDVARSGGMLLVSNVWERVLFSIDEGLSYMHVKA